MRPEILERMLSLLPEPAAATRPELQLLYEMLRDYPLRGGKGLRSELLLLCAQAHGARPGTPAYEAALWLAASLELFQNWVLIHDDIADDSEERRGRPALHRIYGLNLALNAGDALHAYMWEAVQRAMQAAPQQASELMSQMLQLVHRTAEGQHLDLLWVQRGEWALTEQDYLEMVGLKTAWYTVIIPLRLGVLAAGQEVPTQDIDGFEAAGLALGAAFQIRDDVLNLAGEAQVYGKEIGGDLQEGKRTLMTLHWLRQAPEEQRAFFLQLMLRPRAQKTPQDIEKVLHWLHESGSVDYAQQYAMREGLRGLELLQAALERSMKAVPLADTQAAAHILQLVRGYVTREA